MTTAIAALPFFGGTLSCFDPADANSYESTGAADYDHSWATCGLLIGTGSYVTSPTWTAASTFWNRFFAVLGTPASGAPTVTVADYYDGSTIVGQLTVTFVSNSVGWTWKLYTLQTGVLTLVGSSSHTGAINPFDVNIVGNSATGSAAFYSNSTLAFSASGLDHSGFTGVTSIKYLWGTTSPASWVASEIICDSTSTVGRRLKYATLNTNSATNTGWTGTATDIDEIPTSDASFIYAASANLVSTFYNTGLSLGTDNILAVGVGARMRVQGAGPAHIQLAIRSGVTNYFSSSITADTGFQAAFNSWTTDPNTSAAWTDANAAAAEEGVKSIA